MNQPNDADARGVHMAYCSALRVAFARFALCFWNIGLIISSFITCVFKTKKFAIALQAYF